MGSIRRIKRDIDIMKKEPPTNCSIEVDSSDMHNIKGIIMGPEGTPYEGGIFKIELKMPEDYPFKPPTCKFKTKLFHPNVKNGSICLDILKSEWSPALNISKLMLSICSLLSEPNPDDPLDTDAARLYKSDREAYNNTVREWVLKFAQ